LKRDVSLETNFGEYVLRYFKGFVQLFCVIHSQCIYNAYTALTF